MEFMWAMGSAQVKVSAETAQPEGRNEAKVGPQQATLDSSDVVAPSKGHGRAAPRGLRRRLAAEDPVLQDEVVPRRSQGLDVGLAAEGALRRLAVLGTCTRARPSMAAFLCTCACTCLFARLHGSGRQSLAFAPLD